MDMGNNVDKLHICVLYGLAYGFSFAELIYNTTFYGSIHHPQVSMRVPRLRKRQLKSIYQNEKVKIAGPYHRCHQHCVPNSFCL